MAVLTNLTILQGLPQPFIAGTGDSNLKSEFRNLSESFQFIVPIGAGVSGGGDGGGGESLPVDYVWGY
jgi:hypothetical protein